MEVPFKAIQDGLNVIGEFFKNLLENIADMLSWLNPLSDNFFLKGLLSFLGEALSYINPFDENFILKGVFTFLGEIISYINPFSENFFVYKLIELLQKLFEFLFVPKEDHFSSLQEKFKEKLGFINQVSDLVSILFNRTSTFSDNSTPPNWSITFYGTTVNIIDWTIFEKYRGFLHGLIIFILWGSYAIRLFKRIPMIIYAYDDK